MTDAVNLALIVEAVITLAAIIVAFTLRQRISFQVVTNRSNF